MAMEGQMTRSKILLVVLALAMLFPMSAYSQDVPGSTVGQQADAKRVAKQHRWYKDWQFWTAVGFQVSGVVRDVESTHRVLRDCAGCYEANSWLYGKRPSRHRMYLTHVGIVGGMGLLSYKTKQGLREIAPDNAGYAARQGWWLWTIPQAIMGTAHHIAANGNNDLHRRVTRIR